VAETDEWSFRNASINGAKAPLRVIHVILGARQECPLLLGEFNRSTQHYLAEALRRGAGAIPPLRTKILDTALVPRALGRRTPHPLAALPALPDVS